MKMITVPRTVLQLQYEAVRLPIVVLDAWVLGCYLAEESRLRLSFERALASCDTAAGWLLDDRTLRQRAALRQRTAALTRAAQLAADASHRRGQAEQHPTPAPGPTGRRARAQRDHLDDVAEARGDEEAGWRRVAEQADARGKTERLGRDGRQGAARRGSRVPGAAASTSGSNGRRSGAVGRGCRESDADRRRDALALNRRPELGSRPAP